MATFCNYYTCYRRGYEWQDEWSAICDDDCPECGARHVSPLRSEDVDTSDTTSDLRQRPTFVKTNFVKYEGSLSAINWH